MRPLATCPCTTYLTGGPNSGWPHPNSADGPQIPPRKGSIMKKYALDTVSRQRDPNLRGLIFDHGSFTSLAATATGQAIESILTSRAAVAALVGAISAAPSRPPQPAVEQFLADDAGNAAFENETKKMIGRMIRQIVEHLGGRWVRRGVPVTVKSSFSKGSIYAF
jgi:hypothetical protein